MSAPAACAFCNVKTGMPRAVDPMEPENTAIAAAKMGLEKYRHHQRRPRMICPMAGRSSSSR